ncbi:MAG TPA: IclR family transcriptional regulator [Streptosporangiaceae bacterium]|nr:IclR family transcriptional regulator [Streptosporangiaceae bacterium]
MANRSVVRALSILELMARLERPLSLGEIATELKLPKSSALTLLRALTQREFASVDARGYYVLAVRSFETGAAYLRSMTPVRAVEGELRVLTESLGATSHFAVLDQNEVLYLAKHDPPGTGLKLASSLGARLPAMITAVGKAQLAYRPAPDGGWPEPLRAELASVRRLGHAVDEGQTATGIRCVAAPVFSNTGCCGAVGVSYLLHGRQDNADVVAAVMAAARRASVRLGGWPLLAPADAEEKGIGA